MELVVLRLLTESHEIFDMEDEIVMALDQRLVLPEVVQDTLVAQLGWLGDALYLMMLQHQIVCLEISAKPADLLTFFPSENDDNNNDDDDDDDVDTIRPDMYLPNSASLLAISSISSFCVASHPSWCSPI